MPQSDITHSKDPSYINMASNLKFVERFLNITILIILLVIFYVYYLQEVSKQFTEGITNTAKYERKVTEIEPPVWEVCLDPFYKPSVFEEYGNITNKIFFGNVYPEVLINNTILNIFDEATYQLNKDFTIVLYGKGTYDINITLELGENQIQWGNEKKIKFEVKKIRTTAHGNCYVILPKNVSLTPGDQLNFYISTMNTSSPIDYIRKMELFFSSEVSYNHICSTLSE